MPVRIPKHSIVVIRDGKHVIPPLGQMFEFTDSELADINAVNPDAVRLPVNESASYAAAALQLAQPDYAASVAADPLAAVAAKLAADPLAAVAAKLAADPLAAVAAKLAADNAASAAATVGGKKAAADAGGDL